ncbi:MAG: SixA phosphatase family protein [Thermoguttaceae bacterium]
MILYIIRHAWAVEQGDPKWPVDAERPLTEEGRQRFAKMIKLLAERDFAPEVVATSPLVRCCQTAEIIASLLPDKPEVIPRKELAPKSDLDGLVKWTGSEQRKRKEVAWVGHAPDVSYLAAALVGDARGAIRFAKGGIAAIQFEDVPQIGRGELRWLVTAKVLGC